MFDNTIYKGRATTEMYDELMDMLNYVFGFSSADYDFQKLLPKLYADKEAACHDNYIVAENGKIKAAVGAFDDIISVGGGDSPSINESYMLSVFNYKKVVGALLKFKAFIENLPDGEFTVLIHGYTGDCKLKISVCGGIPSVCDYDGEAEIELEHRDAAKFFFGIHSPYWKKLTLNERAWLPLPLYVEDADHV